MNFFGIFGSIFEVFIVIAIVKAIYKAVVKGRSTTLDSTITKFVTDVKKEFGDSKTKITTSNTQSVSKSKEDEYYDYSTKPSGSYNNADELLKAGIITKAEYRKIKK